MRMIQKNTVTIGLLLLVLGTAAPVEAARDWSEDENPWGRVVHDTQGNLLAAEGREDRGIPVALSASSESHGDQLTTRISYQRGPRTLSIERTFRGSTGIDSIYEAGEERLVVSLAQDDLTGESLVIYRLPSGNVYSLWLARDGEVLSGDIQGLRRALREPMEITRLLRSYLRQKGPFSGELPSAGEVLLAPMVSCEDACAAGCDLQCAVECRLGFCSVCQAACAIGCIIGCSGS